MQAALQGGGGGGGELIQCYVLIFFLISEACNAFIRL